MLRGLYSASSAMLANWERQRVLAHNIANIDTPGFKQVLISLEDFAEVPAYLKSSLISQGEAWRFLGEIGLGVKTAPEVTDFNRGAVLMSGGVFDLAIEGEGFFHIETPEGEYYTRDGRFNRDADGQLVTLDGHFVLDTNGRSITLPEGVVEIQTNGAIIVEGTEIARIGLVAFENPKEELTRAAPGMFTAVAAPSSTETGAMRQGYLEGSNVDSAQVMTQMVTVQRAYEAAQRLVQVQDQLLGRSIQSLGRL